MNHSYIFNPTYCEGTLRSFDPIENYLMFPPLCAKTHRRILVPIEYIQCVEGGATECMYGHTFNLLYREWMVDKLANSEPTPEEKKILDHLLALKPHCNTDLYPRALTACLTRDEDFLGIVSDSYNRAPDFEFQFQM